MPRGSTLSENQQEQLFDYTVNGYKTLVTPGFVDCLVDKRILNKEDLL